jgi:hypothetical protein
MGTIVYLIRHVVEGGGGGYRYAHLHRRRGEVCKSWTLVCRNPQVHEWVGGEGGENCTRLPYFPLRALCVVCPLSSGQADSCAHTQLMNLTAKTRRR